MKKIIFLLSLFLLCIGSVSAQLKFKPSAASENETIGVTTAEIKLSDAPSGGKWAENTVWYYILHGNGGYVSPAAGYADNSGLLLTNKTKIFSEDLFWCIVSNEEGGYKFYNRGTGPNYILGMTGSEDNARTNMYDENEEKTDVTTTFDFTDSSYGTGNVSIYKHLPENSNTNKEYWNFRNPYFALWGIGNAQAKATSDQGSAFKFISVKEDFPNIVAQAQTAIAESDATPYFKYDETNLQTLQAAIDANDNDEITIDQALAVQQVLLSTTGRINTTFEDGTQLIFGNLLHTDRYMGVKSSDNGKLGSPTTTDWTTVWTLKEAEGGRYKFYNEYIERYIGEIPHGPNENDGNNVPIGLVADINDATAYTISASPKVGYCRIADLTFTQKNRQNFHMVDWDGIVRWDNSSDASQFKIIDFSEEMAENWSNALTTTIEKTADRIGYKAKTPELQEALEALADNKKSADAYHDVEVAWASAPLMFPEPDKYYTIRNAKQEEYLFEKYDELQNDNYLLFCSTLKNETLNNNIVPALWKFERMEGGETERKLNIKSVNSNLYISKANFYYSPMHMMSAEDEIGEFDIFANSWVDVDGAINLYDPTHDGAINKNNNGRLGSWKDVNSQNNWFIEKVDEIPVTITDARYATLNLPFAVQIPTDKVTAYTATDEGNVVELHDIKDGLIPANTPVILEGNPDTYTLTIVYGNTETLTADNALSGTTVPAAPENANADLYILKNGGSGVGMYRVTTDNRTVGANKAYLLSTETTAEAKAFSFGGTTTGITSAPTADAADGVYYDLRGRLVAYPSHGVYVKSNGQKVLVK